MENGRKRNLAHDINKKLLVIPVKQFSQISLQVKIEIS